MRDRCLLGWHKPWTPVGGWRVIERGASTCCYCGSWHTYIAVFGIVVWSWPDRLPWRKGK